MIAQLRLYQPNSWHAFVHRSYASSYDDFTANTVAIGLTALAIDRRALLVSALAYVLWRIGDEVRALYHRRYRSFWSIEGFRDVLELGRRTRPQPWHVTVNAS